MSACINMEERIKEASKGFRPRGHDRSMGISMGTLLGPEPSAFERLMSRLRILHAPMDAINTKLGFFVLRPVSVLVNAKEKKLRAKWSREEPVMPEMTKEQEELWLREWTSHMRPNG